MNDILDLDVSGLVEDSGDASFPLVTEPLEGEVSWDEIYSHVDGFTKWNFDNDTSSFSATGYEPYLADLRKYNSADFFKAKRGELFEVNEDGERVQVTPEDIIEFVSDIYEKVGIYPIRYYSQAGIDNEISKCINYTPVWSGHNKNVIVAVSSNGSSLCSFFMPNLFKTPSAQEMTPDKEGGESAWDKFYNRKYLEKVVSFCYNYNYKEDSGKIGYPGTNPMSGIRMIGSVPTNFMPMNAKAIYEKFCPEYGAVILDFASGFGGRLLGALTSKYNYRYVGMDPNTESLYNVSRIGNAVASCRGIYPAELFELHCCGSEEFVGPENSVDFAFSSPPYFSLEMYGSDGGDFNNDEQCWKKYPTLDVWLEGYVRKTIKNLYRMLKPGSYYAVNIADFVLGSTLVKYVDDWKRISYEEGFVGYKTRNGDQPIGSDAYGIYLGARARAGASTLGDADGSFKEEVLMVFRKPE